MCGRRDSNPDPRRGRDLNLSSGVPECPLQSTGAFVLLAFAGANPSSSKSVRTGPQNLVSNRLAILQCPGYCRSASLSSSLHEAWTGLPRARRLRRQRLPKRCTSSRSHCETRRARVQNDALVPAPVGGSTSAPAGAQCSLIAYALLPVEDSRLGPPALLRLAIMFRGLGALAVRVSVRLVAAPRVSFIACWCISRRRVQDTTGFKTEPGPSTT